MLALLTTALLATLAAPPASATHSVCHNNDPEDIFIIDVPRTGRDLSIDTGLGGLDPAVCYGRTAVHVAVNDAPNGPGQTVRVFLCEGACDEPPLLYATGASLGPDNGGLTCALNFCVYAWVNGVQVLP